MAPLIIKPTKTTPLVWFEPQAGTCVIAGHSLPENAPEFYGKLLAAMDEAMPGLNAPVRWEFRLIYFNTSSTKGIYQVLARIKAHMEKGVAHSVIWDVEEDDEFMREAGENFKEMLAMDITFREVSETSANQDLQRLSLAIDDRGK